MNRAFALTTSSAWPRPSARAASSPTVQPAAQRARTAHEWQPVPGFAKPLGQQEAGPQLEAESWGERRLGLARGLGGAEIDVVYEAPVAKLLPEHAEGDVLRVLDGVWMGNRWGMRAFALQSLSLIIAFGLVRVRRRNARISSSRHGPRSS